MWLYLVFKALIYHIAFWNWLAFYVFVFLLFIYFEVIHPAFLRLPALCSFFCCVSIRHDVKLDVSHNAKLLFYVSFYISSRNINWMLFERVEWQQFNLPFSSRENFSLYLRRRKNRTAVWWENFSLVRNINAGIVVVWKKICWHICQWKLCVGCINK